MVYSSSSICDIPIEHKGSNLNEKEILRMYMHIVTTS